MTLFVDFFDIVKAPIIILFIIAFLIGCIREARFQNERRRDQEKNHVDVPSKSDEEA